MSIILHFKKIKNLFCKKKKKRCVDAGNGIAINFPDIVNRFPGIEVMLWGLDKAWKRGKMLAETPRRKLPIQASVDRLPLMKFLAQAPQACAMWVLRNWVFPFLTYSLAPCQLPSWETGPGCPFYLPRVWSLLSLGVWGARWQLEWGLQGDKRGRAFAWA